MRLFSFLLGRSSQERFPLWILISLAVVFVTVIILLWRSDRLDFFRAQILPGGAILSIVPASGTFTLGEEFTVNVQLETGGDVVGGVLVDVTYSSNLAFIQSDDTNSVFGQEVIAPEPMNNRFESVRVRFDEGFTGSEGQIIALTFRALSAGEATITIGQATSEVIAFADSSNILVDVINGSYTLQDPLPSLSIVPPSETFTLGEEFTVNVQLETGGDAVGGVLVDVTYSSNLEFIQSDDTNSVFDQEVIAPEPVNNHFQSARLRFDEGFTGSEGQIIALTFRALSAGEATITIGQATSEVIAFADSSNILVDVINGSYTLQDDLSSGSCGDGSCNGMENCFTCMSDCACAADKFCEGGQCFDRGVGGGGGGGGRRSNTRGGEGSLPQGRLHGAAPDAQARCLLPLSADASLPERDGFLLMAIDNQEVVYRDVPISEWFARYVFSIMREGVASGYKDAQGNLMGSYGPANSVTYAEIAKMALEIAGENIHAASGTPTNPTARGEWSEQYIALAEARGLSVYMTLPSVNTPASRGAVIQSVLEAVGIPIVHYEQNPYYDLLSSHPYADAILSATTLGIIRGDTDERGVPTQYVRPDDAVNRAEVAKILAKVGGQAC